MLTSVYVQLAVSTNKTAPDQHNDPSSEPEDTNSPPQENDNQSEEMQDMDLEDIVSSVIITVLGPFPPHTYRQLRTIWVWIVRRSPLTMRGVGKRSKRVMVGTVSIFETMHFHLISRLG